LRDFSDRFRRDVSDPIGDVAGDVGDLVQSGAEVSAAGNPALALFGLSDPASIEEEVEEGPDRVRDVARAPENERSSRRAGEVFGEGLGEGAAGVANVPAFAVGGIELGEVGRAGAEAAADGEVGQFFNDASAAGAAQASDTARAAGDNPLQFGGQLVGGAAVGFVAGGAAVSVGRRAARGARGADDVLPGLSDGPRRSKPRKSLAVGPVRRRRCPWRSTGPAEQ